ncbi:6049_t:CDS:1 [Dentiscutata heterogama]|uniref:6049_t:CDS:1 n=1 Tax=Dentiscutata heterogama TaxID=1316150 RepID=A0ACA9LBR5_9GLOM|nr:6049_t:CDS:1 [Dentiscutata heterogama]
MSEERPYIYENSGRGDGGFIIAEPERVEERSYDTTRKAVHIASDVSSKVSSKIAHVHIFQNPREYIRPVLNGVQYIWNNFPPLSWFGYGALVLNAIPLAIFGGFLLGTTTLVLSIAGVGVFLAEGFFFGLGLIFLVPVGAVMCFAALSTAFFTTFGYCGFRGLCFILRNLGILAEEVAMDANAAIKGAKKALEEEGYGRESSQ